MISFLFITLLLLAVISIVYASLKNGITPMPAASRVRHEVSNEINRLLEQGMLVEAGSGWGTLALHIAKRCPGLGIIGVENSLIPLWVSRFLAHVSPLLDRSSRVDRGNRVSFIRADLYRYPYESVDLIVCYLYPGAMTRLSGIFQQRLSPGQQIISVCFALPGWKPDKVITCKDIYRTPIYVYTIKAEINCS